MVTLMAVSTLAASFLAAVLLLLAFLAGMIKTAYFSPLRRIPGPWHAHFTNLRLKVAVITGKRVYYVNDLHARYGPVVRISPAEIAVNDVKAFREIHRIGSGFNKSPWYQSFTEAKRPTMFAMTDPKQHAARRKLFARTFSKTFLRQHWENLVREKASLAVRRMEEEARREGKTDMMKWWMFLATDVITHLMFGESFRTLEMGQKSEYSRLLEIVLQGAGIGAELPFMRPILRAIPHPTIQDMFHGATLLRSYAEVAVRNSRQLDSKANVFATIITEAEKGETEQLTDLDVKLEAGGFIVAGSDTTGITLTYLIWAILKRPELQCAVEDEVSKLPETVTDAALEQLPLLNACIEETLRLYGAASGGLPRAVPPGGATLGGYFVPEGTTVTTQAWSLHRDAANFTDPETFDPWRWLPPAVSGMSEQSKAAYSPFGAGSRTCVGIHLAGMELRLAAALFFRKMRGARLAEGMTDEVMEVENFFLIVPKGHYCDITLS